MHHNLRNAFPEWVKNATVYEVNLRQYTPGGTIAEFRLHLSRLRELGVKILWFMPVQPIGKQNRKGSLGSYYSISDYCRINPEFGTLNEFRALIDEIHSMEMCVILDWVANHTAWDHVWVSEHPDFYARNEQGFIRPPFPDWEDVVKLDYSNLSLWNSMTVAMKFWVSLGIDGFRCDMAHLVPAGFWESAVKQLRSMREDLYFLAESDQYDLLQYAFHSSYDWRTYHAMNELASGKINAIQFISGVREQLKEYPETASLLRFITNHDENSWHGSELERLGWHLEPMTILYFTLPGIPLVYSGQEAGNPLRLPFFDKAVIEWKSDKMNSLISKLIALRRTSECLWSNSYGGSLYFIDTRGATENTIAYIRQKGQSKVLVMLNFSDQTVKITVPGDAISGTYRDLFLNNMPVLIGNDSCFEIGPYGFKVYTNR